MRNKSKKQISQAVYEENLYVTGKIKRRSREYNAAPATTKSSRNPFLFGFLSTMTIAVAYTVIVSYGQINIAVPVLSPETILVENKTPLPITPKPEPIVTNIIAVNSDVENRTPLLATGNLATMDDAIYNIYSASKLKVSNPAGDKIAIKSYQKLAKTKYSLAKLFGLGVRTIVIDPGHGGRDPGAIGKAGTYEKDIALEIGKRLRDRLVTNGNYHVLMTRDQDVSMPLNQRVQFANENNADLFISIHLNYFPGDNGNFVETYYFGPTADSNIATLAERENADSHYVYAEFKDMIQKIGDTMKYQESKELADAVQHSLFEEIHQINASAADHGIKPGPFVVLLGLDAPSILTEVTSLNDQAEEKRLNSPAYRDNIAKFIANGIVNYLNKNAPLGEKGNGHEKENLAQTTAETQ